MKSIYLFLGSSTYAHSGFFYKVIGYKESDSEIKFELACSGKKSNFQMYRKWYFFPFDVLQKIFWRIFKVGDPEIRDPRPRLPYNGPIICVLFEKKNFRPISDCHFFQVFPGFDPLGRCTNSGSIEIEERGLLCVEVPTHGVLTNAL